MTLGGKPLLLQGVGLGGWLLPEGYMWKLYTKCDRPRRMEALVERLCGADYARRFWRRYYDEYITERDIEYIAASGFNSVRLPINARHLSEGGELRGEYLRHIDECVAWCKKHGLLVILDMHAAPGGQTGKNIDDSERDFPALFTEKENEDRLVSLWCEIAERYKDEPSIGAYDLLNEPLAQEFSHLYPRLLPLYRRLMRAIREYDKNHMLMLEGVHWATELEPLEGLTSGEAADNVALQFHKYWSPPDAESLLPHIRAAGAPGVPLYDGESGENNAEWNSALFPMLERMGIGWCFWSYKKMETANSIAVFPQPPRWDELTNYIDGGAAPERPEELFDGFLDALTQARCHDEVVRSIFRRAPVSIPAEAYDAFSVLTTRKSGAHIRMSEPVSLLFADGHEGVPDYARYGGEPQPKSELILARLLKGESLEYRFRCVCQRVAVRAVFSGEGELLLDCGGNMQKGGVAAFELPPGAHTLRVECAAGEVLLSELVLTEE